MSFYGDSCLLGPGPKASSRRKVKNTDNNISFSNWACKSPLDSYIYFTYAFLSFPSSCLVRKRHLPRKLVIRVREIRIGDFVREALACLCGSLVSLACASLSRAYNVL